MKEKMKEGNYETTNERRVPKLENGSFQVNRTHELPGTIHFKKDSHDSTSL